MTPQLIVSLTPDGKLKVELPGFQATRRSITLTSGEVEETLLRILRSQLEQNVEIGLDSAPTGQQVKHWESHHTWGDARCRFCIAEGKIRVTSKRVKRAEVIARTGDVEVRRILGKGIGKGKARMEISNKSAEELGL